MIDMLRVLRTRAARLGVVYAALAPAVVAAFALGGCGGSSDATSTVASGPTARVAPAAARSATTSSAAGKGTGSSGVHRLVPYMVDTSSMEPTYMPETTVHYDPARTSPRVDEVIVFYLPVGYGPGACGAVQVGAEPCPTPESGLTKKLAIKRVAGLPGDTIAIRGGRVIRNGKPEPELPTIACGPAEKVGCEMPKAIKVPAAHYFVMGTNLGLYKEDSRIYGPVPKEAIVGVVVGR